MNIVDSAMTWDLGMMAMIITAIFVLWFGISWALK